MTQQVSKSETVSRDLQQYQKYLGLTVDEQIAKNQALLKFVESLLDKTMSQAEMAEAQKSFERFKEIVDDNRTRQLFDKNS